MSYRSGSPGRARTRGPGSRAWRCGRSAARRAPCGRRPRRRSRSGRRPPPAGRRRQRALVAPHAWPGQSLPCDPSWPAATIITCSSRVLRKPSPSASKRAKSTASSAARTASCASPVLGGRRAAGMVGVERQPAHDPVARRAVAPRARARGRAARRRPRRSSPGGCPSRRRRARPRARRRCSPPRPANSARITRTGWVPAFGWSSGRRRGRGAGGRGRARPGRGGGARSRPRHRGRPGARPAPGGRGRPAPRTPTRPVAGRRTIVRPPAVSWPW